VVPMFLQFSSRLYSRQAPPNRRILSSVLTVHGGPFANNIQAAVPPPHNLSTTLPFGKSRCMPLLSLLRQFSFLNCLLFLSFSLILSWLFSFQKPSFSTGAAPIWRLRERFFIQRRFFRTIFLNAPWIPLSELDDLFAPW